uniref:SREBP regulating gene protein n=1 Tax=Xenopsylla cheopis TaxID=163159 RepID=A0A6M2DKU6_XENCH
MWLPNLLRFLRRRLVLGFIFIFSLIYCIVNLIQDSRTTNNVDIEIKRQYPFVWRIDEDITTNSSDLSFICRNSVQGRYLIVDDRGVVCQRSELLANNCCGSGHQYNCESCNKNHCCAIYEFCVSCCLDPEKKPILQKIFQKSSDRHSAVLASVRDQFELCLTKCRTSSSSVKFENTYRDPRLKHCYADESS